MSMAHGKYLFGTKRQQNARIDILFSMELRLILRNFV